MTSSDHLPLVSLVTPSFNQGEFLEATIQSVLQQDYPRIEYIIIDGGSTDNSLDIIRKYEKHLAYWSSENDNGSSEAINKGWRQSKGDYLWVLSSDDLLTPNAVSILVRCLEDNPSTAFVYGDMYYIDRGGKVIGAKIFPDYTLDDLLFRESRYPFPGCLMRREVLDTVGYFDTAFRSADDLDFLIRLALRHQMGHLNQFTGYFRVHAQASTQNQLYQHGEEVLQVYEKILQHPDLPPAIKSQANQLRGIACYKAAYCYARSGHAGKARQYTLRAFRLNPRFLRNIRLWIIVSFSLLGDAGIRRAMAALLRFYRVAQ